MTGENVAEKIVADKRGASGGIAGLDSGTPLRVVQNGKLHASEHTYGQPDALSPANIGQYGVAALDVNSKVPAGSLPDAIVGAMKYKGTWSAVGGVYPTVPAPALGDYWVISAAGTMGGVDYEIGDWLVCNNATGPVWAKIDNSDKVSSVDGQTGPVSLTSSYEPVISPKGSAFNKAFGTGLGDVCQGNDGRLSDARVPTAHDHTTLTTPVTSVLYVDGGRGDTYVENGSITKPFKTIAAAEAVATGITALILIRKSTPYVETLVLNNVNQIIGRGMPIIQGNVSFTGSSKIVREIQVVGNITCHNVTVVFTSCECTGNHIVSGTSTIKMNGGIFQSTSGKTLVMSGAGLAIKDVLLGVTGNNPAIEQTAGVVTLGNALAFGASATTEVIKSTGGQILISETVIQNLGGGAAANIANGATTSPNILSNLTCIGGVACGTAVTVVEGITFASGALTGSMIFYRPASMISNTPAGGIAATTVQAAINELDGDKANTSHVHAGSDINSGTLDGDRLPAFSTTKKAGVPATGTPSGKYLKDDGTWATVSGGVDSTAIHKATAAEISAITPKTTLVDGDMFVLEDSDAANAKKMVTLTNILKLLTCIIVGPTGGVGSGAGTFGYIFAAERILATHVGGGTNDDGYFLFQVTLPSDCGVITNVMVVSRRNGAVDTFDFLLSKEGVADANMNVVNILPGSDVTLTTYNFTPAGTHTAGDVLLLKFRSTCDNLEYAQLAQCCITYRKKVVY